MVEPEVVRQIRLLHEAGWGAREVGVARNTVVAFPGGWTEESSWPDVIPKVVTAMERLHATLAPRALAAKART
jgi:hypothetical protein